MAPWEIDFNRADDLGDPVVAAAAGTVETAANQGDAIGVDGDGVAWMYAGKAGSGFATGVRLGPGWGGYSRIGIADSNGDGWADLFAIKPGTLSYWNNRGNGTFTSAVEVRPGWSEMEWVAFADVNGDNYTDILGRDGGNVYLYIGKGNGSFAARTKVSEGWASLTRHTAAEADADGDGDIWATNGAGELFFWERGPSGYATAVIDRHWIRDGDTPLPPGASGTPERRTHPSPRQRASLREPGAVDRPGPARRNCRHHRRAADSPAHGRASHLLRRRTRPRATGRPRPACPGRTPQADRR